MSLATCYLKLSAVHDRCTENTVTAQDNLLYPEGMSEVFKIAHNITINQQEEKDFVDTLRKTVAFIKDNMKKGAEERKAYNSLMLGLTDIDAVAGHQV